VLLFEYLDPGDPGGGLSTLASIGSIVGAVLLPMLVVAAIRFLWRRA
jgi:hypothetical protein